MKSRYTNVKYHYEISWYFSVHCLPQSLRNYKEEAKIKPSKKALAMPGQQALWVKLNKNKCLSCICHIVTCDSELSFHESKQTVPAVNAISSDFLSMNFNLKKDGLCFSQKYLSGKSLVFFVWAHVLLVLTTEVKKCYVYELNSNGANKPVLVSVLCCTDKQCIFIEINTFESSWVELRNSKDCGKQLIRYGWPSLDRWAARCV